MLSVLCTCALEMKVMVNKNWFETVEYIYHHTKSNRKQYLKTSQWSCLMSLLCFVFILHNITSVRQSLLDIAGNGNEYGLHQINMLKQLEDLYTNWFKTLPLQKFSIPHTLVTLNGSQGH